MATSNIYSKRKRKLNAGDPDVLSYDKIPQQLRVQIIHILNDAFDGSAKNSEEFYFQLVREVLIKEYGVFELNRASSFKDEVAQFILYEKDIDNVLDAVELIFRVLDVVFRDEVNPWQPSALLPDDAIDDLNTRFKEHGIGYSFESGEIIKVDSTYVHAQVVKPTLKLLSNPLFTGANEEYLKAHEHYRHGSNKECLTECLKAFESTLKTIFTHKSWVFDPKDTASTLLNIAFNNNLIPSYLQTQLTSLKSILVSGIPTLRNRLGGHGQGATRTTVDDETARYALNITGSSLIYLIELSNI